MYNKESRAAAEECQGGVGTEDGKVPVRIDETAGRLRLIESGQDGIWRVSGVEQDWAAAAAAGPTDSCQW